MLAVAAVFVAALSFLLIEGSLVYYLMPAAPAWLRRRKDVQVTLSSLLVNGIVAALFMMGQYLVDLGMNLPRVLDVVLVAVIVAASTETWRRLHAFHRRLREEAVLNEMAPAADGTETVADHRTTLRAA